MRSLDKKILDFMSFEAKFEISKFKEFISDRFDADMDEVQDSIRRLEEDGDIYRPEKGRVTRLEA